MTSESIFLIDEVRRREEALRRDLAASDETDHYALMLIRLVRFEEWVARRLGVESVDRSGLDDIANHLMNPALALEFALARSLTLGMFGRLRREWIEAALDAAMEPPYVKKLVLAIASLQDRQKTEVLLSMLRVLTLASRATFIRMLPDRASQEEVACRHLQGVTAEPERIWLLPRQERQLLLELGPPKVTRGTDPIIGSASEGRTPIVIDIDAADLRWRASTIRATAKRCYEAIRKRSRRRSIRAVQPSSFTNLIVYIPFRSAIGRHFHIR